MLAALAIMAMAPAAMSETRAPYPQRPDVQQFIDELTIQHGFERQRVERWLSQARYSPAVERYMQPPIAFGQRNWLDYRARYLDEARVQAGAAFVRNHQMAMERAQREFGVPAEIIAAIIGVETYYGRITGNFRTLDALVTLSFDYLRRADYYRQAADGISTADARTENRSAHDQGVVCGRCRPPAVHAGLDSPPRCRLRRRRPR